METRVRAEPTARAERTSGAGGSLVVPAALGAVAVHALTVLVVAPEGSPSVGDRVLALGVIAGAVTAVAAVARRGPSWLRAAGLLVVGFPMIAVLASVVADRVLRGLTVGSALGLGAGLGGVVLVIAGWRRALSGLSRPWVRVLAAVLGTLAIAQLFVLPAAVALLVTNRGRPEGTGRTPASVGLAYEEVRVPVGDGLRLAGWWVPPTNDAAVILLHGSGSTREDVLEHAALIAGEGYGALLLDLRGHGDSPGRIMDMGRGAEADVRDALTSVLGRPGVERVGLLGLSMGGEIALTAVGGDARVGAVVAEGATGRTYADTRVAPHPNPLAAVVDRIQFAMIDLLAPEPEPIPMTESLTRARAPVLLIEGNGPREQEVGPVYAGAEAVTLWSLPDTPHTRALWTHPREYRERVLGFLARALASS